MPRHLNTIVSGGQTGADLGGLEAARILNLKTGGLAPKGYWTEQGPLLDLRDLYGLREAGSRDYKFRTKRNVIESDGTVVFSRNLNSAGTKYTIGQCHSLAPYPLLVNPENADVFVRWLEENRIQILNVAGNRESKAPGIQAYVRSFIVDALE